MIRNLRDRTSPADLHHVYNPAVGYMNPLDPGDQDFPSWRDATRWTADLHPGQTLFVGTGWAHHVQTLETSISVGFDFVDHTNLDDYAASTGWASVLGDRIKRTPGLVSNRMVDAFRQERIDLLPATVLGREAMAHVLRASLANDGRSEVDAIRRKFLAALPPPADSEGGSEQAAGGVRPVSDSGTGCPIPDIRQARQRNGTCTSMRSPASRPDVCTARPLLSDPLPGSDL